MGNRLFVARLVASVGGVGYSRLAPGTVGSLVAMGLGVGIISLGSDLSLALAMAVVLGFWSCGVVVKSPKANGKSTKNGESTDPQLADPQWIVIDELCGQWLVLLAVADPHNPWELLVAFLLFRLLDILKPPPICWAERFKGGIGVMADDLVAGIIGGGLLMLYNSYNAV